MKKYIGAVVAFAVVGGIVAITQACDDDGSHILVGRIYDTERDCMYDQSAIDIVAGSDPGSTCNPVCVVAPPGDGGVVIYVTSSCDPIPPDFATNGPFCAKAIAAFQRADDCIYEAGGSTNPIEAGVDSGVITPVDSGQPVDSGEADTGEPADAASE